MMTDEELIKALRDADDYNQKHYVRDPLHTDAVDRIEQLVQESNRRLDLARSEGVARVIQFERAEAAEAKLAKAMEALRFTDDGANHGAMTSTYGESALRYILRGIRERVRAVLAELEKTE